MAKLLILTASKDTLSWKSLPNKLAEIKLALNSGKNADFTIDIQYTPAIPKIDQDTKRINHAWLDELALPYFNQGFDIIGFHFSRKQYVAWDIKDRLGGSNPNTKKDVESLYWWADEDSKRNRHNKFVETFLHEVCHGYYQQTGIKDITHETDEKHGTVISILPTLDWSLYQPRRMALKKQKNAVESILKALQAIFKAKQQTGTKPQVKSLLHPVEKYRDYISREYGVEDRKYYPQTGRHIGTDYACPVGTSVLAPCDGEVIVSGTTPALGNFCHFKYTFDGVTYVARFLHLSDVPYKAKYKRGEVIELSGKTGKISGPHLHVDVFYNDVRLDLLTSKNWNLLTINPQTHYAIT